MFPKAAYKASREQVTGRQLIPILRVYTVFGLNNTLIAQKCTDIDFVGLMRVCGYLCCIYFEVLNPMENA
jgi:hypothetical protein